MDKLQHAKTQESKILGEVIDVWFERHFHNVLPHTALHASLTIARDDLKRALGVSVPVKLPNPQGE